MDVFTMKFLAESATSFISKVAASNVRFPDSAKKREKITDALTIMHKASLKTANHIKKNGYEANEELSELWADAFDKAIKAGVGKSIPEYLIEKSKFWSEPNDWLNEPASMEIVPKLKKIQEDCQQLLVRINR